MQDFGAAFGLAAQISAQRPLQRLAVRPSSEVSATRPAPDVQQTPVFENASCLLQRDDAHAEHVRQFLQTADLISRLGGEDAFAQGLGCIGNGAALV